MANRRILILLFLISVASGCNFSIGGFNAKQLVGSGNIVAEEARTAGFRRVVVSNSFDLEIRQGDAFYVLLEADDADASGASKIRYSGDPASKRTESSGASSVESE